MVQTRARSTPASPSATLAPTGPSTPQKRSARNNDASLPIKKSRIDSLGDDVVGAVASLPTRRSSSASPRKASAAAAAAIASDVFGAESPTRTPSSPRKGAPASPRKSTSPRKPSSPRKSTAPVQPVLPPLPFLPEAEMKLCTTIPQPALPFSFAAAKTHLCAVDCRFNALFEQVEAKPFLELERGEVKELDLFKTLTTSILGQQISWLAARSIIYKFCRLFSPSLPEVPDFDLLPREELPFPDPRVVCEASETTLRSAGLSGRKVEYVQDIARRFADGRLDARKIIRMSEEEVIEELVQIRGVGRWTAEMLMMFALRRPNVLPVGDLGVQRGMVLFNLAGPEGPKIASKKRKTDPDGEAADEANGTEEAEIDNPFQAGSSELVPGSETDADVKLEHDVKTEASLPLAMAERRHGDVGPSLAVATGPPAPADSLAEGESSEVKLESVPPIPAEAGLTFKDLRARADGKKIKGNLYLSPAEMAALAKSWEPYRSVGVFFMWALVD